MPYVFVFGTLKHGFPLHEEGLSGAEFLGRCRTVQRYPMLIAGPRFAPMILCSRVWAFRSLESCISLL